MGIFKLKSNNTPGGDQPKAIAKLIDGINQKVETQLLIGVTGSGKTFTMANVIANFNKPAIVLAHNKTLAAQLYFEMKEFFPENAVEYFVSYYDYYQPEAYVPRTDTFIEKDASINDQIDLLRHSATRSLLERKDVIVVASVSAIYGLGSPELYQQMTIYLDKNKKYKHDQLCHRLVELQYVRNDINFDTGTFRVAGENIDIFPAHYSEKAWRLKFFGDTLEAIYEFDPLTGKKLFELEKAVIFANSHFVTPQNTLNKALKTIRQELEERLEYLNLNNYLIEAQRLAQRTNYDLEMLESTGQCKGIENYSRHFTEAKPGSPPPTLFQYVPKDALLFVDESHVMLSQIRAMYNGDKARKSILVEHGFRLPSAMDNRPLTFDEWDKMRPQTILVSATPSELDLSMSEQNVEQIIRPTGLLDPVCIIKPAKNQIEDLLEEIKAVIQKGQRILVTALTKKMAEDLTEYLLENSIKSQYLHSDVQTFERIEIIRQLRKGEIDVIVGINLLREGLDIPECSLVAILDADKEGFLRSAVTLIQTIGRAARNIEGKVILYGDFITNSMKIALRETERRRSIQEKHNIENNIIPRTITRSINEIMVFAKSKVAINEEGLEFKNKKALDKYISKLEKQMLLHAKNLEFELASVIRDQIKEFKMMEIM